MTEISLPPIQIKEKPVASGLPDITVTFPGGKRVDAAYARFTVQTDQPKKDGGDGSAPAPFMLFLSSLATCAGIYVLNFCEARELDHDGITLTQRHEFEQIDEKHQRLARVTIQVEVPPGFPEKYHAALQKVASQCLVKKVIENPPEFAVETVVKAE